jgi:protein-tyrosine phosphatase
MVTPIEHCYWVVENQLLAGEYPRTQDARSSRRKIDALIRAGVTAFVDLTGDDEGLLPYHELIRTDEHVVHLRFPIPDVSIPRSRQLTTRILDAIDTEISKGGTVYVHCWGGVGRTGVIIGCWIARHHGFGKTALLHLRQLWQHCPKSRTRRSPETSEQEQYIVNWKEDR